VKKGAIIEALATGLAQTDPVTWGYSTEFNSFKQHRPNQPAWLTALHREGYTQFAETGFPTTHDEDWRFTNVSPIAQTPFILADGNAGVTATDLEPFITAPFTCCLVFVNGRFSPQLSRIPGLPKGVEAGSLAQAIVKHPAIVERYLGKHLDFYRDAFSALNTAFVDDGAYVYVPRSTVLDTPIYALYVSTAGSKPVMTHPRNLVVIEENSQATIVEDYVSLSSSSPGSVPGPGSESAAFSNAVTELVAGESAVVSHYMIVRESEQSFNVSTLRIQQARSSNVATHSLLLGGALIRNNVHPVLAGEGAECLINGLFMANGRQHMDNYMLVEHASPHCDSRQFYNGILNGQSRGVFHGRIIVHKDAQKTDAKQTNRNLLLCDDAQIDTKPQLEIYADDVKCTHGATIGQVDESALFYLRSRGLSESSAKHLLLEAFANECLDRMHPGPVRDHVERLVVEWLPETAKFVGERSQVTERALEEVG
jgi:Fe-S cluster assembly protein SufD